MLLLLALLFGSLLPAQQVIVVRRTPAAAPPSGGITWTNLYGASLADADEDTGSVSVTSGNTIFALVAYANTSATEACELSHIALTGTGISCTNRVQHDWGSRRSLWLVTCSVSSTASIAINVAISSSCAASFDGAGIIIDEGAGSDATTPVSNATCAGDGDSSGTSETVSIGAAPDAGDHVWSGWGHEDATKTITLVSEIGTLLDEVKSITGVRQILTARNEAPDATPAPSISWPGGNNSAGCAAFVNGDP